MNNNEMKIDRSYAFSKAMRLKALEIYSSVFSLKSIRLSGQYFTRVRKHAFTRMSA